MELCFEWISIMTNEWTTCGGTWRHEWEAQKTLTAVAAHYVYKYLTCVLQITPLISQANTDKCEIYPPLNTEIKVPLNRLNLKTSTHVCMHSSSVYIVSWLLLQKCTKSIHRCSLLMNMKNVKTLLKQKNITIAAKKGSSAGKCNGLIVYIHERHVFSWV